MTATRNPFLMALIVALLAGAVALFLLCGLLSMRRAMPTSPNGLTSRTAAVEAMNERIERGGR